MSADHLTPDKHKELIESYSRVCGFYKSFADVFLRILEKACKPAVPQALIRAREKSLSSFAEKVARKYYKYKDPVREFTDLCGSCVVVQTLEQVQAVCEFIEANFEVIEKDDKGLRLGEEAFGHRDIHYIVQLRPDRDAVLGVTPGERDTLNTLENRKVEIQVRTWLQHAWDEALHDRIYKHALPISREMARAGSLLAAEVENGDRGLDQLVRELDGLIDNYTAWKKKTEIRDEIGIQEIVFANEPDPATKPVLALKLARLYEACGKPDRVAEVLEPYIASEGIERAEVLQEFGFALCRLHRAAPESPVYSRGISYLEEGVAICSAKGLPFVADLRKRQSVHARTLVRLGWALERISGAERRARGAYQQAHELEPGNPYHLAAMLGSELRCVGNPEELRESLRPLIRVAAAACHEHARHKIELPAAYFTAARLHYLLREPVPALGWYARGIRHCLEGVYCVPQDALENEADWLAHVHFGKHPPTECQHMLDLLSLAQCVEKQTSSGKSGILIHSPVLIVAGGADTLGALLCESIHPLLRECLAAFEGTVISGGTTAGVPGVLGDVASQLGAEGRKKFRLIAYRPEQLGENVHPHRAYDDAVTVDREFSPEQILRYWSDILSNGIHPHDVLLLGIGGGVLSALEYQIASSFGVSVGLVAGTGGTADSMLRDPVWAELENFLPLLPDPMTLRTFVTRNARAFDPSILDEMGCAFHERYVAENICGLPDNMKPWRKLDETFKTANLEQAAFAVHILEAAGFRVRKSTTPIIFDAAQFTREELERMSELEHGRWNLERLRNGWRPGPRDNAKKLHDCLVPWTELPETIRSYDREAVRAFPRILAKAGMEVYRF